MDYRPNGFNYPYMSPYTQAFPDQLAQLRNQQYAAPTMNQPPVAQTGNAILWVQGEAGAKSYLVAPGSTVLLMDSEDQVFYLKSADVSGLPTMRAFEYKERTAEAPKSAAVPAASYVTREEFEELKNKIDKLSEPVEISPIEARRATRSRGGNADESSV